MLPADLKGLYEAYSQVYDNDGDFITDDLIEEVVEELIEECVESGYTLEEASDAIEEAATEYLMELNPYAPAGSKAARAYQKSTTATKRGEARKAAVKGAVERVKAKAKGAVAAAGIAGSIAKDEARRAGRSAAHAVTSAAQKKKEQVKSGVKGLLKKGLSAVAGGASKVAQKAAGAASKIGEGVEQVDEAITSETSKSKAEKVQIDAWDIVLEFLVAEGYADTNEDALAIMTELDQEIIQSIVEDSATLSAAARKRAEELGRKRRSTKEYKQGLNRGTRGNERAAYNLSNIQRTHAANPSTQVTRSRKPAGYDTGAHKGDYGRFNRSKPENNPKHNANK